jgi:hypothetical protein
MRIPYKLEMLLMYHYDDSILCRVIFKIWGIPDYLVYLFSKADNPGWCSDNKAVDFYERLKCRIKFHPCGEIYYNPGGYEPDARCKNCGDIIG